MLLFRCCCRVLLMYPTIVISTCIGPCSDSAPTLQPRRPCSCCCRQCRGGQTGRSVRVRMDVWRETRTTGLNDWLSQDNSTMSAPLVTRRLVNSLSSRQVGNTRRSIMTTSKVSSPPKIVLTRKLPTSVLPEAAARGEIELVKWDHEAKAADRSWLLENVKGASGIVVMLADKVRVQLVVEASPIHTHSLTHSTRPRSIVNSWTQPAHH